jgi:hypothetical protein
MIRQRFSRSQSLIIAGLTLGWSLGGAIAAHGLDVQTVWQRIPDLPDLSVLDGDRPPDPNMVTAATVSQDELTAPSLWWVRGHHGGKLLDSWIAYTGDEDQERRVDLIVNQGAWQSPTLLNTSRYAFVLQFGRAAQDFGYQLRVFGRSGAGVRLIAAYLCDPPPEDAIAPPDGTLPPPRQCGLYLDPSIGSNSIGPTSPFLAP